MSVELLRAWEHTRRRHGARPAVAQAGDDRVCTFAELDRGAAAWLAAHAGPGTLAGRTVVFSAPNGIGWFELLLGLLRAGAVAVPLDAAEPPAAQRALAAALGAACWWDGSRLEALPGSRRIRDRGVCLIKLTSGTTGKPRPLAFTAAQLLADTGQIAATMGIRSGDLNYALIPLGHSYGLGNLALPLIARGVPLVCGSAPLPHAIFRDFVRWRPTVFPGVPALWRALALSGPEPASLASLRLAISAGAPLSPETARDFAARFGRRLHNFYGSSETGGIAFDRSGASTLGGGVGRALRGVRISRLAGQRIRVCSPAVCTHSNRRRSGRLGCWTLPDRVEFGARGELRLSGRRGQSVKLGGRRANLAEIEARLRRLGGVRDAWIDLSPGAHAVLGAALATERGVAELRAELLADTATWKIPKKWLLLPSLPLTARGKVDGRALTVRLFGPA